MGKKDAKGGSPDDVRAILDSFRRMIKLLRIGYRKAEQQVGLSGAQLFVLHKLEEAGGALSVNNLADRTHTHQSSVSVVVQSLVEKGLVLRVRAADDARRLALTLSPSARTLLRKAPGAAQNRLIAAIEKLPAAARGQLAKLLDRLVQEAGIDHQIPPMIFEDGLAAIPATPTRRRK